MVRKMFNTNFKKIVFLVIINVMLISFFILYKLTAKNMSFFLPLRIEKVIAIILVSICISYSSTVFQTITNNNILTPSVMGLDSLYLFIQTFIVYFLGSRTLAMMSGLDNFFISIIFMIGLSILVFILLFKGEGKSIYFLLLVGMIIGVFFDGLTTFMQVMLDPNEFLLLQGKMFASFSTINSDLLLISSFMILAVFLVVIKDLYILDILLLGRENAISLGIDYKKLVLKHFILISILISVSTALVGPITFLGIIITALSREIFKTYRHSIRIFGGILISIFFLFLSVIIVERVFNFSTTPSVIINLVGGIYFLFIILKESRK